MQWFTLALKRYALFSGRSQRAEFWYFVLFSLLIQVGLLLIDKSMGWVFTTEAAEHGLLSTVAFLAFLLPSLSVGARRLHDIGKSGWWQLLLLLPVLGIVILIAFWVRDGHAGQNAHGSNPKTALGR